MFTTRYLTQQDTIPGTAALQEALVGEHTALTLTEVANQNGRWQELLVKNGNTPAFRLVLMQAGSPAFRQELDKLQAELAKARPQVNREWVIGFSTTARLMVVFKPEVGFSQQGVLEAVNELQAHLLQHGGGIVQVPGEGVTNEEGAYILWQFSEFATGQVYLALPSQTGGWNTWQADLQDNFTRNRFLEGCGPAVPVQG